MLLHRKQKKQINGNHIQEGFIHGHQPAGLVKYTGSGSGGKIGEQRLQNENLTIEEEVYRY
jgi:hypothetical protein